MSQYADVDGYNAACPRCGLWRFEHADECPLRPRTDAEMSEAVAENARRIAAMGGRYGEPAHD